MSDRPPAPSPSTDVPAPRPRLLLRLGVPAVLLAGTGGLLAWTAGDALRPPLEVDARRVVVVETTLAATTRATAPTGTSGDAADVPATAGVGDAIEPSSDPVPPPSNDADPATSADRADGDEPDVPITDVDGLPALALVDAPPLTRAAGWVEPNPLPVTIGTLVPGRIAALPVLEGQTVRAGDLVARLVDDEYRLAVDAAAADLAVREAELAAARAAARRAETDWDEPVEFERAVAAAEAALASAEGELARLPARLAADRAVLAELEEDLERRQAADAAGASSAIELSRARHRAEAQRSRVLALQAERAILAANVSAARAERRAAVRRLDLRAEDRERRDAARARVESAEAAVRQAAAALDRARLDLGRTVLRAPIDGVVLRLHRTVGDHINPNMDEHGSSSLATLYDPSNLQVRVDVPLGDVPKVRRGQACAVTLEALPNVQLPGRVLRFVGSANIQRNTLQVKVELGAVDPALRERVRPEMLAQVRFLDADARVTAATSSGGRAERRPGEPPLAGAARSVPVEASPAAASASSSPRSAPDARTPRVRIEPDLLVTAEGGAFRAWIVEDLRGDVGRARPVVVTLARGTVLEGASMVDVAGGLRPGDLVIDPRSADGLAAGRRVRVRSATGGTVAAAPRLPSPSFPTGGDDA